MTPYPCCRGDCEQGDKPCPCPGGCAGIGPWESVMFWSIAAGPLAMMLVIVWWVLS